MRTISPIPFQAPWSRSLAVISGASTVVLMVATGVLLAQGPAWVAPLPALVLAGAGLFTIRGYEVRGEALVVRRLLWDTVLPLAGLASAEADPLAMKGSIRTAGNGGLFSFTGYYSNRALGDYRALVTDPARAVVLRFATETIVVSPADPQAFLAALGRP